MSSSSETEYEYESEQERVEREVEIGGRGRVGDATMGESEEGAQNVVATATGSSAGSATNCPSQMLSKFAIGPFDKKKPLQQFAQIIDNPKSGGGSKVWKCNICALTWHGSITRTNAHLLHLTGRGVGTCKGLSLEQRAEMVRIFNGNTTGNVPEVRGSTANTPLSAHRTGKLTNTLAGSSFEVSEVESRGKRKAVGAAPNSVIDMFDSKAREEADDAIGKFFYAVGIPFNVARSPYYKEAMAKVAKAGTSYVPPGDTKLRTTILDRNYSKVNVLMEEMKVTWVSHGCSIIMDGWTDIRHRPLINIIVSCKDGPYFLRAIDCFGKQKDVEFQYQILRNAIEEVGPSNVVHIVTGAAYVCRAAGKLVEQEYRHIY